MEQVRRRLFACLPCSQSLQLEKFYIREKIYSATKLNVKKYIGVVPQHINFDQDLTVWENMELHGRLHHIPKSERHARIEELLNYVELQE